MLKQVRNFLFGKGKEPERLATTPDIYRCKICGWVSSAEPEEAIGTAHAHAEKHTGFLSFGNAEKLDRYIENWRFNELKAKRS